MGTIEEFIDQLSIGDIYWFKNPTISSPDPHPHIYVGKEDENHLFLICCTSNFEGRLRHFEINELPFETLVRVKESTENKLTRDTYVDCNEIPPYDVSDLFYDYKLQYWGKISEAELLQIRDGISLSELLEAETIERVLSQFPKDL